MLEVKDLSEETIWGQIKNTNKSFAIGYIGSLLDFGLIKYELFYKLLKRTGAITRVYSNLQKDVVNAN